LLSQGRSDARGYHSRVSTEFCKRGAYVVRNPSIRNEYETLVRSVPNIEGRLATPKLPRGQWVRTIRSIEKSHGGSIPGRKQIYNAVDSKGFATSLKRAADFLYYTNLFQSLQMRPVFSYPARVSRFARAWIGSPLFGTPDYQSPLSSSVVRAQFSWEDLASLTVDDLVYLRKHVCKSLWKQIDSPNPASMEESAREVIESVRATIKHHRLSRHFNMNVAILATALAGGAGSLVLSLNSAAVGVYTLQLGTGVSLAGLGASILGELGHRGRLTALINAVRGLGLSSLTTHKGPTY